MTENLTEDKMLPTISYGWALVSSPILFLAFSVFCSDKLVLLGCYGFSLNKEK